MGLELGGLKAGGGGGGGCITIQNVCDLFKIKKTLLSAENI